MPPDERLADGAQLGGEDGQPPGQSGFTAAMRVAADAVNDMRRMSLSLARASRP